MKTALPRSVITTSASSLSRSINRTVELFHSGCLAKAPAAAAIGLKTMCLSVSPASVTVASIFWISAGLIAPTMQSMLPSKCEGIVMKSNGQLSLTLAKYRGAAKRTMSGSSLVSTIGRVIALSSMSFRLTQAIACPPLMLACWSNSFNAAAACGLPHG